MFAALLLALAPPQATEVALHPRAIVGEDGVLVEGKYVLVRGDKIVSVSDSAPRGARLIELDGVLAPGMVDAFSQFGAAGRITEETERLTPGLRAADGADLDAKDWLKLAERGITSVHLVPEPSNVLAGFGALFAGGGPERLIAPATLQIVSLVSWIQDERVGPTSVAGGIELLDMALAADSDLARAGMLIFVENSEGIRSARALCEKAEVKKCNFVLFGEVGGYGGEVAGELICLPTIGASGARAREAEVMKRLYGAGTRVAFGSLNGAGGYDALRLSAMLLARATGDSGAAWAAVTRNPAELLGLSDKIGRIAAGARADLVLWTAHPLDAAARVQSVMIGGVSVHTAAPK
jgi:imidazolonepropionase-like amidohydrolase